MLFLCSSDITKALNPFKHSFVFQSLLLSKMGYLQAFCRILLTSSSSSVLSLRSSFSGATRLLHIKHTLYLPTEQSRNIEFWWDFKLFPPNVRHNLTVSFSCNEHFSLSIKFVLCNLHLPPASYPIFPYCFTATQSVLRYIHYNTLLEICLISSVFFVQKSLELSAGLIYCAFYRTKNLSPIKR